METNNYLHTVSSALFECLKARQPKDILEVHVNSRAHTLLKHDATEGVTSLRREFAAGQTLMGIPVKIIDHRGAMDPYFNIVKKISDKDK
jgi:hypothetical protein